MCKKVETCTSWRGRPGETFKTFGILKSFKGFKGLNGFSWQLETFKTVKGFKGFKGFRLPAETLKPLSFKGFSCQLKPLTPNLQTFKALTF